MKTYTVICFVQYPAWDERDGIQFTDIEARTKTAAIKKARDIGWKYGATHRMQGRKTFKAYEQEPRYEEY